VSKTEAAKIQKAFHDHAVGMRKKIGEARRKLEKERRMATGKPERKLKPLDPEVIDILNRLALVRGFNLAAALRSIDHPEGGLAGGFATYDTRNITVDPRRMSKHAIAHVPAVLAEVRVQFVANRQSPHDLALALGDQEDSVHSPFSEKRASIVEGVHATHVCEKGIAQPEVEEKREIFRRESFMGSNCGGFVRHRERP
jgi:hypothetical protein